MGQGHRAAEEHAGSVLSFAKGSPMKDLLPLAEKVALLQLAV